MTALLDRECALTRTGPGVYERDLGRVWWGWEADFWPPAAYGLWEHGAVAQSVDLTYHSRSRLPRPELPPGEPLLVVLTTRASLGGLVDEDVEIWSRAGGLLAQSRQMRFVHG